ncbi:response regulator transcription factor [bacterium]|nr:response regulator transcription factor [bacterium]
MINVAIIEDDRGIRSAIDAFLRLQNDIISAGAFGSVEEFLSSNGSAPDVLLLDVQLPGMSGIDGIRPIKEKFPGIQIMMLTVYHDADRIFSSLRAGANGYVLKSAPLTDIKQDILTLFSGGAPMSPQIARKVTEYFSQSSGMPMPESLTAREKDVVHALVDGLSYKMVSDRLGISMETTRFHIRNIYEKLHVHSKAELITKVLKSR